MIPFDRPIVGYDLDDIRLQRGYSTADAQWMYGMPATKWSEIVRIKKDEPVNPTLALLVRILDAYPSIAVIPEMPSAEEMYSDLRAIDSGINMRMLALLAGKEASGGYRWITLGMRQVPVRQRLFFCLKKLIDTCPEDKRKELLAEWLGVVKAEAASRGSHDIFRTGSWSPDK